MRLINSTTYKLEEFIGSELPRYAILSHTWAEEEVTYDDFISPSQEWKTKKGGQKIEKTCQIASQQGLKWAWVDACCINKSSSAELSEAINSMFTWYKRARVCYIWLSDFNFADDASSESMSACRWFTRGWTLQELIAPRVRQFYDQNWNYFGVSFRGLFNDSECKKNLTSELSTITRIPSYVLTNDDKGLYRTLRKYAVCQIFSWAAHRKTTREEDLAYCLLGMFEINMPLLYGEGRQAFRRLQYEIMKEYCDLSILAWTEDWGLREFVLARTPKSFARSGDIALDSQQAPEFVVTNRGLKIQATLTRDGRRDRFPLFCHKVSDPTKSCAILLEPFTEHNVYVRVRTDKLEMLQAPTSTPRPTGPHVPYIYLITSLGQAV